VDAGRGSQEAACSFAMGFLGECLANAGGNLQVKGSSNATSCRKACSFRAAGKVSTSGAIGPIGRLGMIRIGETPASRSLGGSL
jgi:hypothetical protein